MASIPENARKSGGSESSEGDYTYDYMMNRIDEYEEENELSLTECLHYWLMRFFLNGMFTTSRILGYTQLMIYTILRVIITGSLCGRFFGNDPEGTICEWKPTTKNDTSESSSDLPLQNNDSNYILLNVSSYDVQLTCLNQAYGNLSPITAWAIALLPVVLSWLLILPWTPFQNDQEYVVCKPGRVRWPCLTIYVVRLMRSFIRFILELMCTILVPVIYRMRIPYIVTCFQERIDCVISQADEKTFFLWLLTTVNVISCGLSFGELFDICRNKQQYEGETGFSSSISKISSARSSNSYLVGAPNDRVQHYYEKKNERGKGIQTTRIQTRGVTEKRRIGVTRAAADDLETLTNSKFRGRAPKQGETDDVIKLASLKEPEKENKKEPNKKPDQNERNKKPDKGVAAPPDSGVDEGPSTSSSGTTSRNGESPSDPTSATYLEETEHESAQDPVQKIDCTLVTVDSLK